MKQDYHFNIFTPLSSLVTEIPFFRKYSEVLFQNKILKVLDVIRLTAEEIMLNTGCNDVEIEQLRAILCERGMNLAMTLGEVTLLYQEFILFRNMPNLLNQRMATLVLNGVANADVFVNTEIALGVFPYYKCFLDSVNAKIKKFIDQELDMREYWREKILRTLQYESQHHSS